MFFSSIPSCCILSNICTGPVYNQQLISVNGRLTWTIGWSQRVVSQQIAEDFADTMFDIIKKAVKAE